MDFYLNKLFGSEFSFRSWSSDALYFANNVRALLGPKLDTDAWIKDRRKNPKQCAPSVCENNPFRSFVWESEKLPLAPSTPHPPPPPPTAPTTTFTVLLILASRNNECVFNYDIKKHPPFSRKFVFSHPKRQRCVLPSCERVAFVIILFVQASVPSWIAIVLPGNRGFISSLYMYV